MYVCFSWEFDISISGLHSKLERSLHWTRRRKGATLSVLCLEHRNKKTLICSCNSSKIVIEALNHFIQVLALTTARELDFVCCMRSAEKELEKDFEKYCRFKKTEEAKDINYEWMEEKNDFEDRLLHQTAARQFILFFSFSFFFSVIIIEFGSLPRSAQLNSNSNRHTRTQSHE